MMINTIDSLAPAHWVPARPTTASPTFAWRTWLARLWPQRVPAPTRYDELAELDAHTLADIGAPERLLDHAMARHEMQRQERDGLRFGLASGAWPHW
jgi:hypothetical protein